MARELGPTPYGQYAFAFALAFVLAPVADLGTTQYLMREAARDPARAAALTGRLALARLLASATLLAAVSTGLLLFVDDRLFAAIVVAILLAGFADGFSNFVFGYFRGLERMAFEARVTVAVAVLRSAGGALLVLTLDELAPVVAWVVALSLFQVGYAWRGLREAATAEGAAGRDRPSWRTVLAMGLIGVFVMVYLRADAVLIGWIDSSREVGFYTAAYTLMLGLQIVPWLTATALTPVFARTFGREMHLFHAAWREGLRAVLIVALPLALFTGLLAGPLVGLFFGREFEAAASALEILVWSIPLASMNVVASSAFRGAGLEGWLTAVFALAAALNVGLNAWAIAVFGIEGAASVTIATEAAVFLLLAVLGVRRDVVRVPALPLTRLALALLVGAALALFLPDGVPVAATFAACLVAYAIVLVGTRAVTRSDLAILGRATSVRRTPARG